MSTPTDRTPRLHPAHSTSTLLLLLLLLAGGTMMHPAPAPAQSAVNVPVGALPATVGHNWYYKPVRGTYPNMFDVGGRVFALVLVPRERNTYYVSDQVGVYDVTNGSSVAGNRWSFGVGGAYLINGMSVDVEFSGRYDNLQLSIAFPGGTRFTGPLRWLAEWRFASAEVRHYCDTTFYLLPGATVDQSGREMVQGWMIFDDDPSLRPAGIADLDRVESASMAELAPHYAIRSTSHSGTLLSSWTRIGDMRCGVRYDPATNTDKFGTGEP